MTGPSRYGLDLACIRLEAMSWDKEALYSKCGGGLAVGALTQSSAINRYVRRGHWSQYSYSECQVYLYPDV